MTASTRGTARGTQPLQTALKCLSVLEAVAEIAGPVRVSDLARRMGWPRAAIHQQLVTLVSAGWMEQSPDGSYRLTLRSARIGQAALRQAGLGERVLPVIERLMAEVDEAISLAILDGSSATIVQRAEPGRPLQVDLRAEARMPINRSASGRVLLAYATDQQRADLRARGVEIPDEDELREIRTAGFATSSGRWLEGVTAVAAPVFDLNGRCAGALSVMGPTARIDLGKVTRALLERTDEINAILSGQS